ncbi:hypothetical protein [Hymenobacter defluvii]|uniref:Uncharacterized protein n=1 Tax=Hymenobacter defluvii TaxID=2054411 RepID=A0ABS3THR4_9BACT|nr:hypothetical protein [Hymenobacter defluvii]MBO3273190.1 hypothetical protein [Hymenobacter defluvii]
MKVIPDNHFYIQPQDYHDKDALREAIDFGINKAYQLALDRVVILIATRQHTGHIETAYGEELVKKWSVGEKQSNGVIVKIESKSTYSSIKRDLLICISFNSEDLFIVEDMLSVHAIIAVPFIQEIQEWTKPWEAYEIRTGQHASPYPALNCVVRKGLDHLNNIAYGGTSNSSDQYKMKTFAEVV